MKLGGYPAAYLFHERTPRPCSTQMISQPRLSSSTDNEEAGLANLTYFSDRLAGKSAAMAAFAIEGENSRNKGKYDVFSTTCVPEPGSKPSYAASFCL